MKILYAIQTTGNGHISRAQHLLPKFKKRVRVDAIVSGPKIEIPLGNKIIKHYKGVTFYYAKNGKINWLKTLFKNNILQFFIDVLSAPVGNYDLVINDFEPVTAWACYIRGIKCIGLSNQFSLQTKKIPKPKNRAGKTIKMMHYFAPVDNGYGFHYKKYNKHIYYPIIREKVQQLRPKKGGNFLVYLPSYDHLFISEVLEKIGDYHWIIFNNSVKRKKRYKNISLCPINEDEFLMELERAKGVICTSGFTLTSEALYLKKPLLSIPLKGQIEQQYNAAALKDMGVTTLKKFNSKQIDKIKIWANQSKIIDYQYQDESDQLIDRIFLDYIKSLISFEQLSI